MTTTIQTDGRHLDGSKTSALKCELRIDRSIDKHVVLVDQDERTSRGGILLRTHIERPKTLTGTVLLVGRGAVIDTIESAPSELKVGDRVMFERSDGWPMPSELATVTDDAGREVRAELLGIREDMILGVIE